MYSLRTLSISTKSFIEFGSTNILDSFTDSISNIVPANTTTQPLDQNVHIEASFPNVQSHSEIELALNNLINSASQYVNRK